MERRCFQSGFQIHEEPGQEWTPSSAESTLKGGNRKPDPWPGQPEPAAPKRIGIPISDLVGENWTRFGTSDISNRIWIWIFATGNPGPLHYRENWNCLVLLPTQKHLRTPQKIQKTMGNASWRKLGYLLKKQQTSMCRTKNFIPQNFYRKWRFWLKTSFRVRLNESPFSFWLRTILMIHQTSQFKNQA